MDDRPFAGTTALVTGGAKRLGKVIATRLGTLGANVVVHHHTSAVEAYSLCSELQARGVEATPLAADLSDPVATAGLVDRARKAAGHPIDFLINNAATYPPQKLGELSWDTLSEVVRTNAWAPFELTRSFAAHCKHPRGPNSKARPGSVVNLLDARIADYDWDHSGYYLAKRMLADLTRLCAVEYAPHLRVNGVSPGAVLPPPNDAEGVLERLAKHVPLRKTPTPDDVADAVLYLLGASGVTGEVINVDGGRHLGKAVYS